ncbi:VRR-NUC domain-containing protein [Thauera sp. Sel9]|uniref:VRR-NUC domain-containing protein n=1 Tax=Thauera sp. Sel9 TaxID=2974299 RepID=UPI0021E1A869|nr:VRR-NUC domain-containing protein [Thauera sp. Sel9]MCV2218484.1 VRR-NUC domain-containing protein [Thauera sp. Sel9]
MQASVTLEHADQDAPGLSSTAVTLPTPMFPPHRYYYLHNFQRALAWIGERYDDLLDGVERRFLLQFGQLPQPAQALMVRLLMRRGPWFRADKLAYEEIPDIAGAAAPLLEFGWLDERQPMSLGELFALHTKPELLRVFAGGPIAAGMRKAEMLAALQPLHAERKSHAEWNPQAPAAVWRVMVGEICERFRLMFFGNLHQDWSEFVLADLGVFRYEIVAFDAASRAFRSRADVDGYLMLQACRQALDEGRAPADLLQAAVQYACANPWLENRRAKLLLRIGQACERVQDWALAEQAYAQCRYPGARHRRIRVYERMGRFADALALALAARAAPESDEESQRVARMLPRLRRSVGEGGSRRSAGLVPEVAQMRIELELDRPIQPVSVEFVLREHWHSEAAPVFYVENALINSLFGLLCWPAIFAPLPGAFFHPFQSGPADLGAPDFVQRRAALFDACMAQLDDGSYREVIHECFAGKQGLQSPFVFWGALTEELLALALDCMPAEHLKLFFVRLLRDVKANRSGLPDLVRFWPAERRYELVEVKAPGDRLQDNQIRWLQYCGEQGIPVSVCHVRWRGEQDAGEAA